MTQNERERLDLDFMNRIEMLLLQRLKGELATPFCIARIKEACIKHDIMIRAEWTPKHE